MSESLPPLFDGLDTPQIVSALAHFQKLNVDYGTRLMEEGDDDPSMICVVEGELEVRTGDTVLGVAKAGELVGEMALFGEGMRMAAVETSTQASLLLLDRAGYMAMRRERHPLARRLELEALRLLTRRLRATDALIAERAEGTPAQHGRPGQRFFAAVGALIGAGGTLASSVTLDVTAALAGTEMFADVSREALAEVARALKTRAYGDGHFLCTEGEPGDRMFFLCEGEVDVIVATDDDNVEPLATLHAGQAFGQGALVDNRPRTASCIARTNVVVLVLDRRTWEELSGGTSEGATALRTAMIRSLARQLSYANAQLAMLDMQAARKKLDDLTPLLKASAGLEGGYEAD